MKILLLQTDIVWKDPQVNLRRADELIASSPAADLIVLPEMFTTGYATDPFGAAEPGGETSLEWMRQTADRTGAAIAGSVAVEEQGRFYNRMFFVKPGGEVTVYDKRHLFSFAGEDRTYTAGTERVVVEWQGWRILLQVCYDLRFPVFARNRGDYDMIINSASWGGSRIDVWDTLTKARAIENLCYFVAVNRVGRDPYDNYPGGTRLFNFKGRIIAEAQENREEAVWAEINREHLDAFRTKFPAMKDADEFQLKVES
jgi:predicted amidohydrolase